MAQRAFRLSPADVAGGGVAGILVCLTFGTLAAVAWRADGLSALGPPEYAAIRFTLTQALLSAALSVALAIPIARAIARRRFPGREALITLLGAPFILPVIVAVLGLLAVFGRSGVLSNVLGYYGLPPIQIYGFHGVVLAHVFFNLPLATRLLLQGWLSIPAERFRLAASLGFGPSEIARTLEWPMLRSVLPGAFMVIFLICLTSFAVALTLGGGPRATTVELAIYQAFRFDFDLSKAALLALVQFLIGGTAALIAFRVTVPLGMGKGLDRAVDRWDAEGVGLKLLDASMIAAASLFLLTPLVMLAVDGVPFIAGLPSAVWEAALRSLIVALTSAALMGAMALPLAALVVKLRSRTSSAVVEGVAYMTIAASPLVIGTGLFILLFPIASPTALALPVTALVNAAMALPFALRVIVPTLRGIETDFGQTADSLDLQGWPRWRLLILPRLKRALGFALGLAAALSMGDLGVIALFADPEGATLPLQLYRLMAAYRMDDASGAAMVLLALSLLLFWTFDRGGRINADT